MANGITILDPQPSHVNGIYSFEYKSESKPHWIIVGYKISPGKDLVTVEFVDSTFTFHAQWLFDAKCDEGPARDASSAFCQAPSTSRVQAVHITHSATQALVITWDNGRSSRFPGLWLRVMGPVVAKYEQASFNQNPAGQEGWKPHNLVIPEYFFDDICPDGSTHTASDVITMKILDDLLHESAVGIVKITRLPAPNIQDERNTENTIVTRVLKQLFGSVSVHPRHGADKTFNVASKYFGDNPNPIALPNYRAPDGSHVLLPHLDHAHYGTPAQVMGFYVLEGQSMSTFVSGLAVLRTFMDEAPELFEHLCDTPVAIGRYAPYYNPPIYQATVDTAITMHPGFPSKVKRIRWHPHLSGSLLAPFEDFNLARAAHQKFQEIMRRDTHQLKMILQPGDLYVWDNFRLLHGRESILEAPRTGVGQTVPEEVVTNRYREVQATKLKQYIDEEWLVHMPMVQLSHLRELIKSKEWEDENRRFSDQDDVEMHMG